MRGSLTWILGFALAAVVIAAVAWLLVPMKPGVIDTTGRLDTCFTGEPVLTLDGGWESALPADARASGLTYLPLAALQSDMSYDQATGELHSSSGDVVAHRGDRVRVSGTVIEVHGDPSPCYYTLGLRVAELQTE